MVGEGYALLGGRCGAENLDAAVELKGVGVYDFAVEREGGFDGKG